MPTFDAGSAAGSLVLDGSQFFERIERAILEVVQTTERLAQMSAQSLATSQQLAGAGRAAQQFGTVATAATAKATAQMEKYQQTVNATRGMLDRLSASAGKSVSGYGMIKEADMPQAQDRINGVANGMQRWQQEARAAAAEVDTVRDRLLAVGTQCAATSVAFAGVANGATIMSQVVNASFLGAIAKLVVLRREARLAATELGRAQLAGNLGIAPTAGALAASRSAALPAAMTAVKGVTVASLAATAGAVALGVGLKKTTGAAIEFEKTFLDVRKNVEATGEQLDMLGEQSLGLSKRLGVPTETLNAIMSSAGQLGIATENIAQFTEVMAEMDVASDMTADSAATSFAKWANITNLPQKDIDSLTDAVVKLGSKTAATESGIVELGLRMAGAGNAIGLLDGEIAGVAAAVSSLGMESEAGGTAIMTVMLEIAKAVDLGGKELAEFAFIAGDSIEGFSETMRTAPSKGLLSVIEGMASLRGEGSNVSQMMENLGLSGQRVQRLMLGLTSGSNSLKDAMVVGNKAYAESNARSLEMAERLKATATQMERLGTNVRALAIDIGQTLQPVADGFVWTLNKIVEGTQAAVDALQNPDLSVISAAGYESGMPSFDLNPVKEKPAPKGAASTAAAAVKAATTATKDATAATITYEQRLRNLYGAEANLSAETLTMLKSLNLTPQEFFKTADAAAAGGKAVQDFQKELSTIATTSRLLPKTMTADLGAKEIGKQWLEAKDAIGLSIDETAAKLEKLGTPKAVVVEFTGAAKAAEAADKVREASKKAAQEAESAAKSAASAAKQEQEQLLELGKQVNEDLNQSAGAVEDVRKAMSGLSAQGLVTYENLAKLAKTTWDDMRGFPLEEQAAAITGIDGVNQGLAAQIAVLRDRDRFLGSDFYRGLKDGPDVIGEVTENVEELRKAAVMHADAYSLFGEQLWKKLETLSASALKSVYDDLDALGKAAPDMAGVIDRVREGLDAGLQNLRVELGKDRWEDLNPQIEVGVKLKDDALNLQARIDDMAKGLGGQTPAVNVVPFFDAKKLTESFLGAGPDAQRALENMFGKGDQSKAFIDGLLGHKSTVSKALLERVNEAVEYARERLDKAGAQAVLLNWDELLGLGSTGLDALVTSLETQITRLNLGIEQPPAGIGLDAYIDRLEETLGLLDKILPAQAQMEADAAKGQGLTDAQQWAKSSSDLEGWAGIAEDITAIGGALGRLGPKFEKVQQGAAVAGDAIKLAMAVASGDPVSMAINGINLLTDVLGMAGDEAEEMKTGMDRVFEEIGKSVEGWVDDMTDSIIEFVKTGEMNFKEFVDSVLEDMLRLVIKYGIMQPMMSAVGIDFAAKGKVYDAGNIVPFAKGGAFADGMPIAANNIIPFARGGVVEKASLFDIGMMGEAGPEAIMPLERTKDGALGVRAIGANAGAGAGVNVTIVDQSTRVNEPEYDVQPTTGPDGAQAVKILIRDAVRQNIAEGAHDRDFAQFGMKRRAM